MKHNAIATIFATVVLAIPAIGHAQHLCWIERVVQTDDGVALHFTQNGAFYIAVARHGESAKRDMFIVRDGVAWSQNPNGSPGKATEVVLPIGDKAEAWEMHSSCVLRADRQGDVVGVAAEAHINLPGRASATQTHFFVAE
ncbi:hypothetical protein [Ralstonia solanacearum]|uniref:Uncharacterized protein n=1 Tax=Ralstonia solanacearum TaxID=305 RepID=A0AAE3NJT5_RALSL|nr:hypothetical protein [Ralstonia solanacearum]MBB6583802.1 hypothetical protein [Ralstonia solanacearum]MDB0521766.1 hypothetical protein [Ralstonia solanacearum]